MGRSADGQGRWQLPWRRRHQDEELEEELRFHVEEATARNLARGMAPHEARRQALVALGGVEQTKEEWRDASGTRALRDVVRDARYALRAMARSRVVTAVAVVSLALGIGANTAIFSLLDAATLQTLPVPHPEQLVTVRVEQPGGGWMSNVPSELFDELRASPRAFSGIFAFFRVTTVVQIAGDTFLAPVQRVSGGYYQALGVVPRLGRLITPADDAAADTSPVAVISHAFWMKRFAGDRSAVGRTIYLNSRSVEGDSVRFRYRPVTIIGVTPAEFFGADRGANPDITIPLGKSDLTDLWVMGRLKPGVGDEQARAEVDAALRRALETIRPRLERWRASERNELLSLRGGIARADKGGGSRELFGYRDELLLLSLLSGIVLLIACVNIANLLMARAAARSHEIGIRLALGAGRARLVRQMLTESGLLALLGTVIGVTFAVSIHRLLSALLFPPSMAETVTFVLDLHVLAYAGALAVLCTLVFGLAPALRATRPDITSLLRRAAASASGQRLGSAKVLIVAQVAISLLLVTDAGLLARTLYNLRSQDAGFETQGLLVFNVSLGEAHFEGAAAGSFYRDLVSSAESAPGVVAAAVAANAVFGSGGWEKSVWVEGRPPEEKQHAAFNVVGPGFFSTTRIPVVAGREFSEHDVLGTAKVVVVNEAFARRYLASLNPIGRRVSDGRSTAEVVGVVRNARYGTLREEIEPTLYEALYQEDRATGVTLHVRAAASPMALLAGIRKRLRSLNAALFVYDAQTVADVVARSLQDDRMMASLSSFFGLLALLLTCIGLYGVIAFDVARRTREVGIRIALGADRSGLVRMILRETLALVACGSLIGIPIALASAPLLRTMLFGLRPHDPATLAASTVLLLAVGVTAGYLPARRAARIDAASALRCE